MQNLDHDAAITGIQEIPSPRFYVTDPLADHKNGLISTIRASVHMAVMDDTRAATEEARKEALRIAHIAVTETLCVLDEGYYVMLHNQESSNMQHLAGNLSTRYDELFDEVNS